MMFGFGIKLTSEIIGRHKHGIINAHPGKLKLFKEGIQLAGHLLKESQKSHLHFTKLQKILI